MFYTSKTLNVSDESVVIDAYTECLIMENEECITTIIKRILTE